jgi:putative flippase GtrA
MKILELFDKKFLKFILVGIINTVFGSAIMFLLYNLAHWSYWQSSAANYIAGSILSFFLNKYFTFNAKGWSIFMVLAFVANIALCYFIAYGIAELAMGYFLRNSSLEIRENAALFTGMCLFTGLNYLGQRLVVFNWFRRDAR